MLITNYAVKGVIWVVNKTDPDKNKSAEKDEKEETKTEEITEKKKQRSMVGFIVGRCENILILTFMLLNQVTALVVIIGIRVLLEAMISNLNQVII